MSFFACLPSEKLPGDSLGSISMLSPASSRAPTLTHWVHPPHEQFLQVPVTYLVSLFSQGFQYHRVTLLPHHILTPNPAHCLPPGCLATNSLKWVGDKSVPLCRLPHSALASEAPKVPMSDCAPASKVSCSLLGCLHHDVSRFCSSMSCQGMWPWQPLTKKPSFLNQKSQPLVGRTRVGQHA